MPPTRHIAVLGGGAAGFFAAITCAEALGQAGKVTLFEATPHLLAKVRISGGGRCNVTHACFEPAELVKKYPRGGRELLGAFHRFQPRDTIEWFGSRGVATKTEEDGRLFPTTDDSGTIVDCLMSAAARAGVTIRISTPVRTVIKDGESFLLTLGNGSIEAFDRVIVATGGNKASGGLAIAESFGHSIVPPVPSLFTFHITDPRLTDLAGVSVENVAVIAPGTKLKTDGPVLVTHAGLSGPGILKLSAWGAREFAEKNYAFPISLNWTPPHTRETLIKTIRHRCGHPDHHPLGPRQQPLAASPGHPAHGRGVQGRRQEHVQGRIRHLRWRETVRGRLQDDGKPQVRRPALRRRSPRHRRRHRRLQFPERLDDGLSRWHGVRGLTHR